MSVGGVRVRLNRREWAIFLSCWLIYLFHLGPIPGVNENRYIDLTRSIVEEGRLTIDRYHYNTVDKAFYNGHYYAGASPGPSLLAIPPYLLFKGVYQFVPRTILRQYDSASYIREKMGGATAPDDFVARYPFGELLLAHLMITALTCSLLSACTVILLYRLLGWMGLPETSRLIVLVIYAFGTLMFFYSTRLYAHVPSAFFGVVGFVLLYAIRHGRLEVTWGWVAGLALGLAVLMEYTVVPMVVGLGLYGVQVLRRRGLVAFFIGGMVPVGCLMVYQYVCFGNPLTTAYNFPMSPDDPGPHIDQMKVGFHGFGVPSMAVLWGLSLSPYRGVFTYMPILLCAMYALFKRLRDHSDPYLVEWRVIAIAFVLQFLFNSAMLRFWSGGYVFGPRYLVPIIPLLMLPLARAFQEMPSRLIVVIGLLSILINWSGVQYIVSQSAFGSIAMFLLSGPTSQLYQFLASYFHTYSQWDIPISSLGGFLILGVAIWGIWRVVEGGSSEPERTMPHL